MENKPRFRDRLRHMFRSGPSSSPAKQHQTPPQDNSTSTSNSRGITSVRRGHDDEEPQSPRVGPSASNPLDEPLPTSFNMRVDRSFWSFFDHGDGGNNLDACGTLFYDSVYGNQGQWGRGAKLDSSFFGTRIFEPDWVPDKSHRLPPLLYSLAERRVVQTTELGPVRYAAVSHVWGAVTEIDGAPYGVGWNIPIRSAEKLDQILEAARVAVGDRYIWMDVLCLDQRRAQHQEDVERMGEYYRNATGCLVWLDNAYNDCPWGSVLSSLKSVNAFFKLDAHNMPTVSRREMDIPGTHAVNGFEWARRVLTFEKSPWFRRVWTLQEGVIPENLLFCTPERYIATGSALFQTVGLCEMAARTLKDSGAIESVGIFLQLQQSELYKMLKLRQLYKRKHVSFWHIAHAVRSRSCSMPQDYVCGVSGMLQKCQPVIDYRLDVSSLWEKLYEQAVYESDFSACLYLGERPSYVSMFPDPAHSVGFVSIGSSDTPPRQETHRLKLVDEGIRMEDVGLDPITQTMCITSLTSEGPLNEWFSRTPKFSEMSTPAHEAMATAFRMPSERVQIRKGTSSTEYVMGAWAAYGSMIGLVGNKEALDEFGPEFTTAFEALAPRAMWNRTELMYLTLELRDCALALLLTASSEVQLAILTEPLEQPVKQGGFILTPSSYEQRPGPGCLVCKVSSTGNFKKIGVGLGKSVKAGMTAPCLLER